MADARSASERALVIVADSSNDTNCGSVGVSHTEPKYFVTVLVYAGTGLYMYCRCR